MIVTLTGRVQGVGFRDRVVRLAAHHPVAGTVRNLRSGDALEIDVQGEESAVARFLSDVLEHPPSFARIEHVVRQRCNELRAIDGFGQAASW